MAGPAPLTPGPRSPDEFQQFAQELDAVREGIRLQLGEADARYVRRLLWTVRGLEAFGRAALVTAPALWPTFGLAWAVGVGALALSKCLENMELAHNVMHGQYEWLHDPRFEGKTYEWDNACSKEHWRAFHNHLHHQYTNVQGLDRDFGYGFLRLSDDTPWERRYLTQALYAPVVGLLFEWAFAIHHLAFEQLRHDREAAQARIRALWPVARDKMLFQLRKDYLWWPLLAALLGLVVGGVSQALWAGLMALAGLAAANLIRNFWSFVVIFCGHFTDQVHTFPAEHVAHESKGQWYLRQCLGSANIRGGWWFHVLTGNLSHQIEHHLFPDIPARRYAEMAPQVQAICERHGVPYHTGSFTRQLASVVWRVWRHAFPGGQRTLSELPSAK